MKNVLLIIFIAAMLAWAFLSHQAIPMAFAIGAGLVWAFRSDTRMWREKPREELVAMIQGADYLNWGNALKELRRRGEDISPFIPCLVSRLVADSVMMRTAAATDLKDCFPEFRDQLKDFMAVENVVKCRQRVAPLLERYGISTGS